MDQLPFSHVDGQIAIPCTKCDEDIDIRSLQEHRESHRVWKILRCNAETVPKSMKQLLKRRRQIINEAIEKADPNIPLPAKVLQKIDWAFEIVRKSMSEDENVTSKGHKFTLSQVRRPDPGIKVSGISNKLESCGQSVGICHCPNDTWRISNEDRYTYTESCIGKQDHGFFGLFDGYNGATASEKCSQHFHKMLLEELKSGSISCDDAELSDEQLTEREAFVKEAMKKSFQKMDSFLLTGEFESSKLRWSGTSATVCYIENDILYVANAGSVRGLFVKGDGSAVSLVQDHTLQNKKERDRIRTVYATSSLSPKASLANGVLTSTRGLGNHGDPKLKMSVISKPHVSAFKIDPDDQFLIFYTAGIWDIFNDNEVMFLLEDIMPDTSEIDTLREHLLKRNQGGDENRPQNGMPKIDEVSTNEALDMPQEGLGEKTGHYISTVKCHSTGQDEEQDEGAVYVRVISDVTDEVQTNNDSSRSVSLTDLRRGEKSYKESKACFLARALVERLAYSALLAGSRENITSMVVLLHGCPINLYLLPSVKRKSIIQKKLSKIG